MNLPAESVRAACWGLAVLALVVPLLMVEQTTRADDPLTAMAGESVMTDLARRAAGLFYDDGFYYLVIARRLAAGEGSTFDGREPTGGYHPLWLACLVPLAWAMASPATLLVAVFALQTALAAAAAALLYRAARLVASPTAAGLAVLFWLLVQSTYWTLWSGMEHALHAAAVAALLYADLRWRSGRAAGRRAELVLGLVAAAAFLARIETLLLAAVIAILPRRDGRRLGAAYLLPVAAAVIGWAVAGAIVFDHPLPVSAALKGDWSRALLAADPRYLDHGWPVAKLGQLVWPLAHMRRLFAVPLLAGVVVATAIVALRLAGGKESSPLAPPAPASLLLPPALYALTQYLACVVLYHGGYAFQPWYFTVQPWLVAVVGAVVFDRVVSRPATAVLSEDAGQSPGRAERGGDGTAHRKTSDGPGRDGGARADPRRRRLAAAAVGLVLALLIGRDVVLRRARLAAFPAEPHYLAAAWARAHVEPEATVGAWTAGFLAFFSDRRTVNLDGLVNSWEYYRTGRHDLCAYLRRQGIEYLIDVVDVGEPRAHLDRAADACAGRLRRVWIGPTHAGRGPPIVAIRVSPQS